MLFLRVAGCVLAILTVYLVIVGVQWWRKRKRNEKPLIFLNGLLLSEGPDYTLASDGVPIFHVRFRGTDAVQIVRGRERSLLPPTQYRHDIPREPAPAPTTMTDVRTYQVPPAPPVSPEAIISMTPSQFRDRYHQAVAEQRAREAPAPAPSEPASRFDREPPV